MAKKETIRSLTKKIDTEFSRIVRARGVCARCGKGAEKVQLQCAHIFSRRNMAVRWDFENALSLCYSCHIFWAHKEPILFNDFVREYLGDLKFTSLKQRAKSVKKWTLDELKIFYSQLLKTE